MSRNPVYASSGSLACTFAIWYNVELRVTRSAPDEAPR